MLKLLGIENLFEPLCEFGANKPIFGTCAGAILLAERSSIPEQESLGLMDMTVERNAYGRQIDSRIAQIRQSKANAHRSRLHPRAHHPPRRARSKSVVRILRYARPGRAGKAYGRHISPRTQHQRCGPPSFHFQDRINLNYVKKVLFLCIGNSIRSQMAEGFARKYGADVIDAASAGLAPASIIQPFTKKVMEAKNINLEEHFPKDLEHVPMSGFDIVVNISGKKLPTKMPMEVKDWPVDDPMGKAEEDYIIARDQIEHLVMRLILELRKATRPAARTPKQPLRQPL